MRSSQLLSNNDLSPRPFGVRGMVDRDSLALTLLMAGKSGPVSLRSLGAPSHSRGSTRLAPNVGSSYRRRSSPAAGHRAASGSGSSHSKRASNAFAGSGTSCIGDGNGVCQQDQNQQQMSPVFSSSAKGILASSWHHRRSEQDKKVLKRVALMQQVEQQQRLRSSLPNDGSSRQILCSRLTSLPLLELQPGSESVACLPESDQQEAATAIISASNNSNSSNN